MSPQDRPRAEAKRSCRLDKLLLSQRQHLPAHDARHGQPRHRAQSGVQQKMPSGFAPITAESRLDPALNHALKRRDDNDHENDRRQRVEHIDSAHHPVVPTPTKQAGRCAPQHADHQTHQCPDKADQQRDACAGHHAPEQVAPVHIGAEPVPCAWLGKLCVAVLVAEVGHPRPADREQHQSD
ncbi:MAG: hypothetical protein CMO65_06225 [Verrucomicrobiales bacterium]|nr:hypothetical protein [Verrucomicrobiales bacterium]